jgi:AcrR family transcriptional regulator
MNRNDSTNGASTLSQSVDLISPRQRVLAAAIELFAARGFDAVTVRDITTQAKTNLAAVNYYFESKENLIRIVFKHAAHPMNTLRLEQLSIYEASREGKPLELEPILRSLVDPIIRSLMGKSVQSDLAQIYAFCVMWPPSILTVTFDEGSNDEMLSRYMNALSRALPSWPKEQVGWALYFATGSLFTSTRDLKKNFHFRRLSGNLMDTANPDVLVEKLIQFLLSAFNCYRVTFENPERH